MDTAAPGADCVIITFMVAMVPTRRSALAALAASFVAAPQAQAQGNEAAFRSWLAGLRAEAVGKGISAATLDRVLRDVKQEPKVLELFAHQPEFKMTFERYLEIVASEQRVRRGRQLLAENRQLVTRFADINGLPPAMLVALWGIESNFGERMGDFHVIDSLATLSFNGKRAAFFRSELIAALRIVDQGHVEARGMLGSWAGALGQCQFMPTSFLAYAVDGDGDGRRDIWTSKADVFASIGNYMRRAGWQAGTGWGREVTGTAQAAPPGGRLVRPSGPNGPVYATTRNFAAILRWNQSDFFALGVGLLSDRIAGG